MSRSVTPRTSQNGSVAAKQPQVTQIHDGRVRYEMRLDDLHRMVLESMHFVAKRMRDRGIAGVEIRYDGVPSYANYLPRSDPSSPTTRAGEAPLDAIITPSRVRAALLNYVSNEYRAEGSVLDDDTEDDADYATLAEAPLRPGELRDAATCEWPIRSYHLTPMCGFECEAFNKNPGFFPFHPLMASTPSSLDYEVMSGPPLTLDFTDLGLSSAATQRHLHASPFNALWTTIFSHCLSRSTLARLTLQLLGVRAEYRSLSTDRFHLYLHITLRHPS